MTNNIISNIIILIKHNIGYKYCNSISFKYKMVSDKNIYEKYNKKVSLL